ncbi:MAG TPA: ATP-binding protein [Kofleriaceae bacterium]
MFEVGRALPALLDALNSAGVGFVVFVVRDGTTEKVYANNFLATSLGYTREEWLATPLWHAIAADQKPAIVQIFERAATDTIPAAVEVRLIHKDGHEILAEVAAGRTDLDGARYMVCVVRDMQRQTQLSLLEADRIALVGALAAGFAHETNNPLTSVLLNLRSLRKQVVSNLSDAAQSNALRCLEDITTGAERIASNVRALQTLATRSATQSIDLAAVVSAALRLAAPTLEPRAHVIRQIFPVAPVAGEESRIGQAVLAMLLFSSSGFDGEQTSASNRIVVAVEERDAAVVVEVSDNGRDLTGEEVQHAFDPFFRSPVRGAGVGVGLGVARSVAITLGGEVTLAKRTGGGAVITMRLPLAPDRSPAPADR